MKKNIYYFFLLGALVIAACNKNEDIKTPSFNAVLAKSSYKAGDTVTFKLSGKADYVTYYSGEQNAEYSQLGNFTAAASGDPEMEFLSNVQFGTTTINNLSVLISNDFNGTYNADNVSKATWADATSKATLGTSATNVTSKIISLSQYKAEGKPLYVAFRYKSVSPESMKQRQWHIEKFIFRTKYSDGKVYTNAADNTGAGFTQIEFAGDSARWTGVNSIASVSIDHVGKDIGLPADDDWAISRRFDLNKLPANTGEKVRTLADGIVPTSFTHIYSKAGIYKAVFVSQNATISGSKQIITEVEVRIE